MGEALSVTDDPSTPMVSVEEKCQKQRVLKVKWMDRETDRQTKRENERETRLFRGWYVTVRNGGSEMALIWLFWTKARSLQGTVQVAFR
jgi:hypothetical protein